MALNEAYFDGISIDVAKKKYYNVNKVEAVLQDIRQRARELNDENESLRRQVSLMSAEKSSVGDALISARTLAQQIINEARAQAQDIIRDAEEQRQRILDETGDVESIVAAAQKKAEDIISGAQEEKRILLDETREQQEYTALYVQGVFEELKEQQLKAAKSFDLLYQQFLCGLFGERTDPAEDDGSLETVAPPEPPKKPDELCEIPPTDEPADEEPEPVEDDIPGLETVPADLKEKVSAIARALLELEG